MVPIHSSWQLATWFRVEDDGMTDYLPPQVVADLFAEIEGVDDATVAEVRTGLLRQLLTGQVRPDRTHGAAITDDERGVSYYATIGRGPGRVWLRTVEVIPHDPEKTAPSVYRVPAQAIADMTAHLLDMQGQDSGSVVIWGEPTPGQVPDAEELAALVNAGMKRRTIAEKYDRSISRVDEWLRVARRERPELFPPRQRGPRPQTPSGKASPGNTSKKEQSK